MDAVKIKKSTGDKIADVLIYIFIGLLSLICILPFIQTAAVSVSSGQYVNAQQILLVPKGLNVSAYRSILSDAKMVHSLFFTVFLTITFTIAGMIVTIFSAYALSRPKLKGRYFFATLFLITMYFSAGIIPDYLLMDNLNILDSFWCLFLPGLFSAYNMIILRTFIQNSIPESLIEAAELDGCDDFRILFQVVLPLSKSVLATLMLFYAVGRWNSFSDALYYIQSEKYKPLQLKLQMMIQSATTSESEADASTSPNPEMLKSASIMFATIPIIIVYPFVQKYFVSGVMIGAVKG
ncbi:MAG: carbohydrate ABC transporter permease [Clostridia bacterium]|nr:carbohydrate ABC transporter permease [Clostridia bacterium]